jgi:hypothetical protein
VTIFDGEGGEPTGLAPLLTPAEADAYFETWERLIHPAMKGARLTIDDYEAACKRAATEQGLDPVTEALQAAGLPVIIEQTGGMCMVAAVYDHDPERWVWITESYDDPPPAYLVVAYGDVGDYTADPYAGDDGFELGGAVPVDELAPMVKRWLAR